MTQPPTSPSSVSPVEVNAAEPAAPRLPIRPSKPVTQRMGPVSRRSLAELLALAGCLAFSLIAPATIVPPGSTQATRDELWRATLLTILGVAVAIFIGLTAFRRTKNYAWLVIIGIPSFAILAGGAIMLANASGMISRQ